MSVLSAQIETILKSGVGLWRELTFGLHALSKLLQKVGRIQFFASHWLGVTLRSSLPFLGPWHVAHPPPSQKWRIFWRVRSPCTSCLPPEKLQILLVSPLRTDTFLKSAVPYNITIITYHH